MQTKKRMLLNLESPIFNSTAKLNKVKIEDLLPLGKMLWAYDPSFC